MVNIYWKTQTIGAFIIHIKRASEIQITRKSFFSGEFSLNLAIILLSKGIVLENGFSTIERRKKKLDKKNEERNKVAIKSWQ